MPWFSFNTTDLDVTAFAAQYQLFYARHLVDTDMSEQLSLTLARLATRLFRLAECAGLPFSFSLCLLIGYYGFSLVLNGLQRHLTAYLQSAPLHKFITRCR